MYKLAYDDDDDDDTFPLFLSSTSTYIYSFVALRYICLCVYVSNFMKVIFVPTSFHFLLGHYTLHPPSIPSPLRGPVPDSWPRE